ncbi:hypothetical protein ACXWOG_10430, partial [Streptococcus pyogenes]
ETQGDLEKAADKDATPEKLSKALEAFNNVYDRYQDLKHAHEHGRIQDYHVKLCSVATESASKRLGIKNLKIARESGDGILADIA